MPPKYLRFLGVQHFLRQPDIFILVTHLYALLAVTNRGDKYTKFTMWAD